LAQVVFMQSILLCSAQSDKQTWLADSHAPIQWRTSFVRFLERSIWKTIELRSATGFPSEATYDAKGDFSTNENHDASDDWSHD